jgi:hypothetical protein
MACDISKGRVLPCTDAIGGLDAVYLINSSDPIGAITYTVVDSITTDIIDTAAGSPTLYKYDLKGTSTFNQVMTTSRENGTTFVEQTLVLNLPVMSATTHKELKLLAYGNPQVIVKTNAGNFFLVGLEFGCDVTTINANSGAAMGDMTGYEVTLVAREKIFANYFDAVTESALLTDIGGTVVS